LRIRYRHAGAMVRAAGRDARVVDLPFAFPIAAPA
jgi:hypothetical protein